MIEVYTHSHSLLTKEFWKAVLRTVVHKYSGPEAVRDSLLRGLQTHGIYAKLNPFKRTSDTVVVLSGVQALREALRQKRAGKIHRLLAGPNLVITPTDAEKILLDPLIDYVVVPSAW